MSSIKIDVSEALAKLDPKDIKPMMTAALHSAGDVILADVARYPNPPANSRYTRTGTLGKGWATTVTQDPMQAIVGNSIAYGPYVQDATRQASVHRGRWQTIQDVATRKALQVQVLLLTAIEKWARR